MNNDFKKGFFFGAGVLTVLLIPTTVYLVRGLYLDRKLSACVKEANDYKDKIVNIHLNKPDADLSDLDFTFENTENRIKICRYNYVRKLVIMPINPNNEP